jgi:hypothetical protein
MVADRFLRTEDNPKREIIEGALLAALRVGLRDRAFELLGRLEALGKDDHATRLVCEYARKRLVE